MGFWDDVNNSFDEMFDFNNDGKLDVREKAMQLDCILEEEREFDRMCVDDKDDYDDDFDSDDFDDY